MISSLQRNQKYPFNKYLKLNSSSVVCPKPRFPSSRALKTLISTFYNPNWMRLSQNFVSRWQNWSEVLLPFSIDEISDRIRFDVLTIYFMYYRLRLAAMPLVYSCSTWPQNIAVFWWFWSGGKSCRYCTTLIIVVFPCILHPAFLRCVHPHISSIKSGWI